MTFAPVTASAPSGIEIAHSVQTDRAEWDAFVRQHPDGSFFHLSGWCEAIKSAYGYEPIYLTARRDSIIVGILPLIDVRAPLLGRSLISTAFTIGGGPIADDDEVLGALLDAAAVEGEKRRVHYAECRCNFNADNDWLKKPGISAVFRLAMPQDTDEALKAIPKRRRADVRKGLKAAESGQLAVRHDGSPETFYKLYSGSLRRLGTPVFSRKFLSSLLAQFITQSEISVVEHNGAPVAALLTFYFNEVALPYYVGANTQARAIHAFDFLYWTVMRRAVSKGCSVFDFGRSRIDSGAYQYKKLWGAEPEPLVYRTRLVTATSLPDISAGNPKFARISQLWPRLPLAVTNRLGPLLAPNFP